MSEEKSKIVLSRKQIAALVRLFDQHLIVDGDFATYRPGWTDMKIREELVKLFPNETVTGENAISGFRRQTYGNFPPGTGPGARYDTKEFRRIVEEAVTAALNASYLYERVAALEQDNARLLKHIEDWSKTTLGS